MRQETAARRRMCAEAAGLELDFERRGRDDDLFLLRRFGPLGIGLNDQAVGKPGECEKHADGNRTDDL